MIGLLPCVAVAAAAEHHDQPVLREGPQAPRAPFPARRACGRNRRRPARRSLSPTRSSRPGAPRKFSSAAKTSSGGAPAASARPAATSAFSAWNRPGQAAVLRESPGPHNTRVEQQRKAFRLHVSFSLHAVAVDANREQPPDRAQRQASTTRAEKSPSAAITAVWPGCSRSREQPQFGGEIIVEAGVVIEMVAREIGESASRQPHAVEPALVEAVRRRLNREMGDALPASASSVLCRVTGSGVVSEP